MQRVPVRGRRCEGARDADIGSQAGLVMAEVDDAVRRLERGPWAGPFAVLTADLSGEAGLNRGRHAADGISIANLHGRQALVDAVW